VVSYGGKTIPRWRTAAILKIDISPYLSEKSSDFYEILYSAADFELDEHNQKWKSCIGQTPSSKEHISCSNCKSVFFLVQVIVTLSLWLILQEFFDIVKTVGCHV